MVIDHLEYPTGEALGGLAYFYCLQNSAEPERQDPEEILRSIARQLSCLKPGSPIQQPATDCYKKREEEDFAGGKLALTETVDLIIELIKIYGRTTIVIDAIDECNGKTRHQLLSALIKIHIQSTSLVKVFVSSRDDHDIVCMLEGFPNIYVRATDNFKDIKRFVQAEINNVISERRFLGGNVSEELRNHVEMTLVARANGM